MKRLSIIATILLCILAYIGIAKFTYDFFLPYNFEYVAKLCDQIVYNSDTCGANPYTDSKVFGVGWPITWTMWSIYKISINYTLAVVVSLGLLAGFYPVQRLISQRHKTKELRKHEDMHMLNRYLKENGVDWV